MPATRPKPLTPLRIILYWLPAFLFMALIFYMSGNPAPEPVKAVPIYYEIKLVHIVEYGTLCALIFYALYKTAKIPLNWQIIFSVTLTYIYGLTDELHQVFVPTRSGKLVDTVANLIGSAIFCLAAYLIISGRNKKKVKFPGNINDEYMKGKGTTPG